MTIKQADFSAETDLKERLYAKLFPDRSGSQAVRTELDDDDAALIFAAGDFIGCVGADSKTQQDTDAME